MQIRLNRGQELAVVFASLAVLNATLTKAAIEFGLEINLVMEHCQDEQFFWALGVCVPLLVAAAMFSLSYRYPRQVKHIMTVLVINMALLCGWATYTIF